MLYILLNKRNGAEAVLDLSLTYVKWLPASVGRIGLKVLPSWPIYLALLTNAVLSL